MGKNYNERNIIIHILTYINTCIFYTDEMNKWNARFLPCRGLVMEEGVRYLLDLACSSTATRAGGSSGRGEEDVE